MNASLELRVLSARRLAAAKAAENRRQCEAQFELPRPEQLHRAPAIPLYTHKPTYRPSFSALCLGVIGWLALMGVVGISVWSFFS